jgi:glycosyltransferase 2 family protein
LKKGIIQALKFTAFLAIGVLLLWLAFRNVRFDYLVDGLKEADYFWLLLSVLFGLFAFLSRARRWMLLIHPLNFHPTFMHTFHALMSGYLANIALPRVGEITRCVALGRKEKIPVEQLIGTVVIERTIDFISLLTIMIVMIFTSGDLIRQFLKESIFDPLREKVFAILHFSWFIWLFLAIAGIVALFLLFKHRKELRKIRFFAKIFDLAKGIISGLKTITTLQRKWEFILHTVFIWLNYALMTWVVVFAVESTSHLTFGNSIFLLVIGGLAMSAPVQSGLGAFHYIVSRGLALVENVNLEDGLIYAILTHESQLLFVLIIGSISFYIMFGHRHKAENNG